MSNDNTEQKTKWDLPRFIQALHKRKPEEEAWFKRYLNIGNFAASIQRQSIIHGIYSIYNLVMMILFIVALTE